MPQVNEVSWVYTSLLLILMITLVCLNINFNLPLFCQLKKFSKLYSFNFVF